MFHSKRLALIAEQLIGGMSFTLPTRRCKYLANKFESHQGINSIFEMEDHNDLIPNIAESSSTSICICTNELFIRNQLYLISLCKNQCQSAQIEIKVEAKETIDQWKSTFDVYS